MNTRMTVAALALMSALVSLSPSSADDMLPPDSTTTVAHVMDRMAAALGDTAAVGRIENMYVLAHSRIPNTKVAIKSEMWWARPNLLYMVSSLPIVGKAEEGHDGKVCWKRSPMSGPRIVADKEAGDLILDSNPDRFARWRDVYLMTELIGTDSIIDEMCDVVLLVPDQGHSLDLYISRATGLPVKIRTNRILRNATLPVSFYLSDYRETDGLLTPWLVLMETLEETQVVQIDSIAYNVKLPKSIFRLPRDIRALAELD